MIHYAKCFAGFKIIITPRLIYRMLKTQTNTEQLVNQLWMLFGFVASCI